MSGTGGLIAERPRSRFAGRASVVVRALAQRGARREPPVAPQRILIAHHLLLGDPLMLTSLLKKLRERHPGADIAMTVPRAFAPLYAAHPYGVRARAWDPRLPSPHLFDEPAFDVAYVPGDNRYAWLAAAMKARWIVAFAGDRPATKNWPIDALVSYPDVPAAWGDMVAMLADGPAPEPYACAEWPAPPAAPFARPGGRYAVLHVGASSPLKQWLPERWRALADALDARGIAPVWSAGRGEEAIVDGVDDARRYRRYAGALDLAQLWHLIAAAHLLVSPDTGIAHLGRLTATPTVTLFGPGSATICGAGDYWRDMPYRAVTVDPFPCRDQHILFRREIDWVQRCGRSTAQCAAPRCMHAIDLDTVLHAVGEVTS